MFFFFNDTATTEIYTLSLHDALPISTASQQVRSWCSSGTSCPRSSNRAAVREDRKVSKASSPHASACSGSADRKSTRLNSSHANISYAVFCLKKKTDPRHLRFGALLH